jgi:hypothetical protein
VNLKVLENSLYWQQVVLKESHIPAQKERARIAIAKLSAQIEQLKKGIKHD